MPLAQCHLALSVGTVTVQIGGPPVLSDLQYLLLGSGVPTRFMEPTQTSPGDTSLGGREH